MSVLATVAAAGWRTEQIRSVFRAAPGPGELAAITVSGIAFWRPPTRALVRAVVHVVDLGDPLVFGGAPAATVVGVGLITNGVLLTQRLLLNAGTGSWNLAGGRGLGWASSLTAAAGSADTPPHQAGGIVLWPANGLWTGETQGESALAYAADQGNVTGTILTTLEWRAF